MSHRLQWAELSTELRGLVNARLGSRVVSTTSATGGYSPAMACVADLEDGRRVFLKAASAEQNPQTPAILRGEARINQTLSRLAAPAPALLDVYDDGEWVILTFEVVHGRLPTTPWRSEELARVARAVAGISGMPAPSSLRTATEAFAEMFTGWSRLRSEDSPSLPPVSRAWWQDNLDQLCDLEAGSMAAIAGDHFVHGDVRSDNIMLVTGQHDGVAAEDRVVFVDWTACSLGAPWLDLLLMAPSGQLEDGCSPDDLFALAEVRAAGQGSDRHGLAARAAHSVRRWPAHDGLTPRPPGNSAWCSRATHDLRNAIAGPRAGRRASLTIRAGVLDASPVVVSGAALDDHEAARGVGRARPPTP